MTNEQILIGLLGFAVSAVLAIGGILVGFLWGKRRGNGHNGRENTGDKDPSFWLMEFGKLQGALAAMAQASERCEERHADVCNKLDELIKLMRTHGRCRYAPQGEG